MIENLTLLGILGTVVLGTILVFNLRDAGCSLVDRYGAFAAIALALLPPHYVGLFYASPIVLVAFAYIVVRSKLLSDRLYDEDSNYSVLTHRRISGVKRGVRPESSHRTRWPVR